MKDESTMIPVKKSTRQKLRDVGSKGETYNKIINRLLKNAGQKDD